MRSKTIPLTFLLLFAAKVHSQQLKTNCMTFGDVVDKTIESIKKVDTTLYKSLYPLDSVFSALEKIPGSKDMIEQMKANRKFCYDVYLSGLDGLLGSIEDEFPGKRKAIQFVSQKTTHEEKISDKHIHYTVEVVVKFGKAKRKFRMSVTKYGSCYYSFEQVEKHLNRAD